MASIVYRPKSNNIDVITWSDEVLPEIKFKTGAEYYFKSPIPKSVIVEWIAAESAGSYFHSKIKGTYELEKVQDGIQDNNAGKSD